MLSPLRLAALAALCGAVCAYDVVIYGATPAGIGAALAAAEFAELKVALVEPTGYVGGMAGPGGIGLRDIGDTSVINGSSMTWGLLNAKHYGVDSPVWQPDSYVGNASFWTMFARFPNLEVVMEERLVEGPAGVTVSGGRVTELVTAGPDGTSSQKRTFQAKYVVDASYEGDVMRFAGVSFTWGRESRAEYNESLAGVTDTSGNQFKTNVSATWANGTLLPWIQHAPDPRTVVGEADRNVMAYAFRLCVSKTPGNRVPILPPAGYDPDDFELARRYIQELKRSGDQVYTPWRPDAYPSYPPRNKYDAWDGATPLGIDTVGLAVGYSNGTYAEREAIKARHHYYVQGLAYFWTYDKTSGIPASTQSHMQEYGLCKDEWPENGHWPPQLYVREAARMVGDRVFTQNDRIKAGPGGLCREDSIAVADWGIDIHEMQRVAVRDSPGQPLFAFNEGLTSPSDGGHYAFEMPYWMLLPKRSEATNLLVPNCPSISHVAFAAVREEPTLMQLGAASGVAAALAARAGGAVAVQDVDPRDIQAELLKQYFIFHFPARPNCSAPFPPPPEPCQGDIEVSGAGSSDCNGVYKKQEGKSSWEMDSDHAISSSGEAVWFIKRSGKTYYRGRGAVPPAGGWTPIDGAPPAPTTKCLARD